ncbi:hypothetical protein [Methylobacillus sp.]|uniref:hypothetical protein n=1 Tax=Methylobacillus sp. TaxID=56818 RepID=UPI002FE29831
MEVAIYICIGIVIGAAIGATVVAIFKRQPFSVVTYPYKEEVGSDGVFSDDRKMEIGYKFQLFVNGIPCFDAHKIPVETLQKKEVRLDKIEAATKSVANIIEHIASMHPAIKAYNTAPELASSVAKRIAKA